VTLPQKTIHRYEIIEKIGEGGMGFVYKARDPRIDRVVALKTIKFGTSDDAFDMEEKKQRFYREAKTSGKLFHQHIVTILDVDHFEDFSYIVMEYVEGETLSRRLRGGHPLTDDDAVTITLQICDALNYAHGVGIVHRDIKPSNVMIIGQNQVKVTDFGLAKMLTSTSAHITKTGGVVGTPFYMAPEQIRGEATDGRIDIFALGVVLYECLTGAKPFVGDSISTIIYKILHENPVSIREFNHALSPTLDNIVQRALAKEVEKRYVNAAEMAKDLQNYFLIEKNAKDKTAALDQSPSNAYEFVQRGATINMKSTPQPSPPHPDEETRHHDQRRIVSERETQVLEDLDTDKRIAVKRGGRGFLITMAILVSFLIITSLLAFFYYPGIKGFIAPANIDIETPHATPLPEIAVETTPQLSLKETPRPAQPTATNPPSSISSSILTSLSSHEAFYSIMIKPVDATIYIDGLEIGGSLQLRKIAKGTHKFEASRSGYKTQNQDLIIEGTRDNPTIVVCNLVPFVARLRVDTTPKGADISINGKGAGRSPLSNYRLEAGKYRITLSRRNYMTHSQEVTANPGQRLNITKTLVPAGKGSISINATPWANILIDGMAYQSTPRTIDDLASGYHKVVLSHPDYPSYKTFVEIPLNGNIKVTYDF